MTLSLASHFVLSLPHSHAHVDVASKSLVYSMVVRPLFHGLMGPAVRERLFVARLGVKGV